jgi:hypothetical protein
LASGEVLPATAFAVALTGFLAVGITIEWWIISRIVV